MMYYNPSQWKTLSLVVNLNKVEVMRLDIKNLTNKATAECSVFAVDMSRI